MAKKINFYFIRRNGYPFSSTEKMCFYSPSLESALEVARNILLDGADSITIEDLGEHDLKF